MYKFIGKKIITILSSKIFINWTHGDYTEILHVASLAMLHFQTANNKGTDQTVQMYRLISTFVLADFLATRP